MKTRLPAMAASYLWKNCGVSFLNSLRREHQAVKPIEGLSEKEELVAAIFRAIGNPARVRIIGELARHTECMTTELVAVLPLAQSTVSEHLRVLKEAGIVTGATETERSYSLAPDTLDTVIEFCQQLKSSLAKPAEDRTDRAAG